MARSTLYEAVTTLPTRTKAFSSLKSWGLAVARRRGRKRATVAVARNLAVIEYRMWIDGSTFRFGRSGRARRGGWLMNWR